MSTRASVAGNVHLERRHARQPHKLHACRSPPSPERRQASSLGLEARLRVDAGLREWEAEAVRPHAGAHVGRPHVRPHVGPHVVGRHACGSWRACTAGRVEPRRARVRACLLVLVLVLVLMLLLVLVLVLVLVRRRHVARHAVHGRCPVPTGVDEGVRRRHHVPRSTMGRRVPLRRLDKGKASARGHAEGRHAGAARVALRQGLVVGEGEG